MRGHRHPHTAWPTALLVLLAVLLSACSSSSGGQNGPTENPTRASNEAYLLKIGYEKEQAACVSRRVKVDLEQLLSAPDGANDITKKVGYDAFAAATRSCIRADSGLTTTIVPPG